MSDPVTFFLWFAMSGDHLGPMTKRECEGITTVIHSGQCVEPELVQGACFSADHPEVALSCPHYEFPRVKLKENAK